MSHAHAGSGAAVDADRVVAALLARHGRTFVAQAGIRLTRNTPAPLFQLLCLALLISARIRVEIAVAAARALFDAGLTTPKAMADATWERRTRLLNHAGYARYDESTSRYLAATGELLVSRDHGDLRRLRAQADGDVDALCALLSSFKGIGRVGAEVFVREVQAVWSEYVPFVDSRTADVAGRLGLPTEAAGLRALVDDDRTFARLVAGLVRTGLARDADAVLDAAAR